MLVKAITTVRILVVSRDVSILRPLEFLAETNDWDMEGVESGWDALERVQSANSPNLVVLDLPRGDVDSLHTLRWLRRLRPEIPVVMFGCAEDARQRIEATRLGAQDYLVKPLQRNQLEDAVKRHLAPGMQAANEAGAARDPEVEQVSEQESLVAFSPVMRKIRAQAELLAQVNVPVLITGESGTGKDVVARLIHKLSDRAGFKFLKVTCGAFEGEVLETELFGHADSSSSRARVGQLELAHKGTILLDEITEIPLNLQAKLLRVMQDRKVFRSGGETPINVDVRVIATTSAHVSEILAAKKLRDDFYYNLSAFMVHVPPLRQRKDDIPLLVEELMQQMTREYGLPARPFSAAVVQALQAYSWPGNLRELENFVKRYLLVGEDDWAVGELDRKLEHGLQAPELGPAPVGNSSAAGLSTQEKGGLKSLIRSVRGEAERNAIADALDQTRWNRKAAARLLQVSYRTLLYKIEHYHMTPPSHLAPFLGGNCQKVSGQGN